MATALRRDPIVQLGEFLRAARERAGLTLQQVSTTTKIPQRHLDAIEHGDISVVPKGPYRRGEVRAFAQAVGLDQTVALKQLDEALPEVRPETPSPVPEEPVEARASWGTTIMLLIAVIGLGALLMWNRDATSTASVTPAATPAPAASAPPPVSEVAPEPPSSPAATAIAPATPATSPAPTVSPVLEVTSDPPGARVVVDGIGRGKTPATIELLALGEHAVRVVRDGYVSEERSVSLTPKRPTTTLRVELRPTQ